MSKKSNNVVITGGSGFVGSNLASHLLKNTSCKVFVVLRKDSKLDNLDKIKDRIHLFYYYETNIADLINFFKKNKPSIVFHLASFVIAEHKSDQIDSIIQSNITFGCHILEAMKESDTRNIVNTGTYWQHYNNDENNPVCFYAASKSAFEKFLQLYVEAYDFNVVNLILYDNYGENDTRKKLINLLSRLKSENESLEMTSGDQEIDYTHVNDVCEAFLVAGESLEDSRLSGWNTYSVFSNTNKTLKQVVQLFLKTTKKNVTVKWGSRPYRKREVMKVWKGTEKLPGWEPKISLEDGFKRFII